MVCIRMVVGKVLQMGQIQEAFSNLGRQTMPTDLWDVREEEKSRITPRCVARGTVEGSAIFGHSQDCRSGFGTGGRV